jgi:hypothetical protein
MTQSGGNNQDVHHGPTGGAYEESQRQIRERNDEARRQGKQRKAEADRRAAASRNESDRRNGVYR